MRYYKGSAPGTHYWEEAHDPRRYGFRPRQGSGLGTDAIVRHITQYSAVSPYVSLTTSFAIARSYALSGRDEAEQGKVWLVDLDEPSNVTHPMPVMLAALGGRRLHDGDQHLIRQLLVGYRAPPTTFEGVLDPTGDRVKIAVNSEVTEELRAIVFALRDAEVLVQHVLPKSVVGCILVA